MTRRRITVADAVGKLQVHPESEAVQLASPGYPPARLGAEPEAFQRQRVDAGDLLRRPQEHIRIPAGRVQAVQQITR